MLKKTREEDNDEVQLQVWSKERVEFCVEGK